MADDVVLALQEVTGIRPCTQRISATRAAGQPCALAELHRCAAPCAGRQSVEEYAPFVVSTQELVAGLRTDPLSGLAQRMGALAQAQRYEQAALERDRLAVLVRALDRAQRLGSLAALAEVVAARSDGAGGWLFAVVRYGRLASAGVAPRGVRPMPVVEQLVAAAETVLPTDDPLRGASPEELGVVLRWLEQPGTRLVRTSEPWWQPVRSAGRWRTWLAMAEAAVPRQRPGEG